MYTIRRAIVDDIPVLVEFRGKMYGSMDASIDFDEIRGICEEYYESHMEDGSLVAWIAEDGDGTAVACVAASLYRLPPKPENPDGRYVYVFNLFTEPGHRRRGLAGRLLGETVDHARDIGVEHVTLHASEMGRPLFSSHGFVESNEMSLTVEL